MTPKQESATFKSYLITFVLILLLAIVLSGCCHPQIVKEPHCDSILLNPTPDPWGLQITPETSYGKAIILYQDALQSCNADKKAAKD